MRWLAAIALLALTTTGSAHAQSATAPSAPAVEAIERQFEYGRYEAVIDKARAYIDLGGLTHEELRDLHRLAGLAAHYLEREDDADRHLSSLLRLDPDHELDPFRYPPSAIERLDAIRKRLGAELELRRRELAARAREEERDDADEDARDAADAAKADQGAAQAGPPDLMLRTVEKQSFLVNFVPLGAGQFQQGRSGMGILLAAGQGALAATSVVAFLAHEALYETETIELEDRLAPGGTVTLTVRGIPPSRAGQAQLWHDVRMYAGVGFYALWAIGVFDALWRHEDARVTERFLPRGAPVPSPGASPRGRQADTPAGDDDAPEQDGEGASPTDRDSASGGSHRLDTLRLSGRSTRRTPGEGVWQPLLLPVPGGATFTLGTRF